MTLGKDLKDDYDILNEQKLANTIDRVFLTEGGKAMAGATCLGDGTRSA